MILRELTLERERLAYAASETELLALLSHLQEGEGSLFISYPGGCSCTFSFRKLSSNSFPGEKVVSYPATQGADAPSSR